MVVWGEGMNRWAALILFSFGCSVFNLYQGARDMYERAERNLKPIASATPMYCDYRGCVPIAPHLSDWQIAHAVWEI